MFLYSVIGFAILSAIILNWLFKKFLNIKPTFMDIMILTVFFLGVMSLFEDLFKYKQYPTVPILGIITSFILAFGRYREINKELNQSK